MVGYAKNDSLTPNQKFIAGCISGMTTRFVLRLHAAAMNPELPSIWTVRNLTSQSLKEKNHLFRFITQPLDVVKLRTQLQRQKMGAKDQWFKNTRMIIKEEGLTALWHGHNIGQMHSILAVTTQFFVYEMSTKYVANSVTNEKYKPALVFLCGIFAGCCSATMVLPLEVIRVRQMLVKHQYKGLMNGAREVYSSGGVLAFYEGLTASILMMGPQVGIAFSVFSFTQPLMLRYFECKGDECQTSGSHRTQYLLIASSGAGILSGFISKTVTYPLDLVKRRMQISSHKPDERFPIPSTSQNLIKCQDLVGCLAKTYQKEGFRGFYRGWKVTIYKAQLTSVVAFTTYELVCQAFREIENK